MSVPPAHRAALVTPRQVRFYEWEPNVYSAPGRQAPAPFDGIYEAASHAARERPREERSDGRDGDAGNDTAGASYFLFGRVEGGPRGLIRPGESLRRTVGTLSFSSCAQIFDEYRDGLRGGVGKVRPPKGSACRAELTRLGAAGPPRGSTVIKVPRGIRVSLSEASTHPVPMDYSQVGAYVIEDDAFLTERDVAGMRPRRARDGKFNATFELAPTAKAAFRAATARIAARGRSTPNGTADFVVVIDEQYLSTASVDPRRHPKGLPPDRGVRVPGDGIADDPGLLGPC